MDILDNPETFYTRQELEDLGYEIDDDGDVYLPDDVTVVIDEGEGDDAA